jgi:phage/plasmid-associated DNA primase
MVQFPASKTICPVLIGKKGDGKSTVVNGLRKILGSSKVIETTNPNRDVWGPFNNLMLDAFLVNINELNKKDFIEGEAQFKALVTDYDITINKKGVSAFTAKSYHRTIITTNSECPIKTSEDERRILLIRCSDEMIGNKKYFDDLYEALDDEGTIKAIYDYFANFKGVENFHKEKPPVTKHQQEIAKLDRTPVEQFFMDFVENKKDVTVNLSNKQLYDLFKEFCDDNYIECKMSALKFGVSIQLAKINGIDSVKTHDGRFKRLDFKKIKKHFNIEEVENNESDDDQDETDDEEA